ncbi:DUF3592 domain-containing protein [Maliponia aquimaris]|uniref:DUF3592 domain-containing protein n=1 Tax=Maliponia aquimaris TaxID=1673631 RepID=A0A238K257_9RHOB|nr:DUF3592 domain-containing protein [Maliponia aquimaris]SMX36026.1 hypothetical protein MAA8898_00727 [Maliponia aquimaris]
MAKVAGSDPVPVWRLFWRMGGWVMLIFVVIVLVLTMVSQSTLSLAQRFDVEGRETTAEVTDKYERVSTDSDGDREVTYYFELRFDTQRGDTVGVTRSVGSSTYNDAAVGDRVPIWYLNSEPGTIELSRGENRTTSIVTRWIALGFGALMLAALWVPGRKAVAAARARRYGRRETAVVTGLKQTSYRVNNRHRYRLTWREDSGRIGESLAYKEDALDGYKPGDKITIYQGIQRAWWSGDVGERDES